VRWGRRNVFTADVLDARGPGVGSWLQSTTTGQANVLRCDNTVTSAAAGDYATNHYQALECDR
jgi:hypothetical protein